MFHACQHDCPDNCAMESIVEEGKVTSINGRKDHPFTRGFLCSKVKNYDRRVYATDRVLFPMRRIGNKGQGKFKRISWAEALDEISSKFREIIRQHGAEAILPYSYLGHQGLLNGLHCGDRFFNQLGASVGERTFCNATASKAFQMVAGPTGGVDPESFSLAKVIIIWGMNPISTSIHFSQFVIEAQKKGAALVVIDPITTDTAKRADYHLRPRPGTDVALAMAVANVIISRDLCDSDYINRHTVGFDEFSQRAQEFDLAYASEITGISGEEIQTLADLIARNKATAVRTGVALERSVNGGDAIRAIAALPALVGAWKVAGGGIFQHPQNSFPIDRQELTNASCVEPNRNVINLFDLASALNPDAKAQIKSLFVYNANPVIAAADQTKLIKNLGREDLFTVVSEVFQTDTCAYADILLPATSQLEQRDLMYSWGHFNLQYNEKAIEPLGEAVSNTELFRRLADATGMENDIVNRDDEAIMASAFDWEHPNLEGVTLAMLREKGFLRLSVGDPQTRTPHRYGRFPTQSQKFEFVSSDIENGGALLSSFRQGFAEHRRHKSVDPLPSYEARIIPQDGFVLISPKHKKFLNSGYANFNLKSGLANKQVVLINHTDAKRNKVSNGQELFLFNDLGEIKVVANVTDKIIEGVLMVNHGYWMCHVEGNTVNALVSSNPSKIGKGITVNDTVVFLRKHRANAMLS